MALDEYPKDIAGYLKRFESDFRRLPTWNEREDLARRAINDGSAARSLAVWDFFFVNESEFAVPIHRRIADLRQQRRALSDELVSASRKFNKWFLPIFCILSCVVTLAAVIYLVESDRQVDLLWRAAVTAVFFCGWFCAYTTAMIILLGSTNRLFSPRIISYIGRKMERHQTQLVKQIKQIDLHIGELEQYWKELKKQLPSPPQPEQVLEWLHNGLDRVKGNAVREAVMHGKELQIEGAIESEPLLTPAVHQDDSLDIFADDPNIQKRVNAVQWINLSKTRKLMPIYCIYKVDIIWPAKDMLTTYSCYYDLIADEVTYVLQTEQYYWDVAAISISYEDQEVSLPDGQQLTAKHVPCLTISLSSGESRRITFNDSNKVAYQLGEREYTVEVDSGHNAVKAIRKQLRDRKKVAGG